MGFQDPVHRAMRPLLLVLLLLLWASLPRRRLQPPVLPDVAQQLAQTGLDPDRRPGLLEVLDRFLRTDRYALSDHLPLHVLEQLLPGDRLALPSGLDRDHPTHDLDPQ